MTTVVVKQCAGKGFGDRLSIRHYRAVQRARWARTMASHMEHADSLVTRQERFRVLTMVDTAERLASAALDRYHAWRNGSVWWNGSLPLP